MKKTRVLFNIVTIGCILFLFINSVDSQDKAITAKENVTQGNTYAEVRGKLITKDGKPAASEQVKLLECEDCVGGKVKTVETPKSLKTKTDSAGRFSFHKVSPGEYALTSAFGPPLKNAEGVFIVIKITSPKDIIDLGTIIFK
jgi:hypothetical protein